MSGFRRVCLVGLDRVIGSFAMGLRRIGFRGSLVAVADGKIVNRAWKLGLINDGHQDLEKALVGADLVMLSGVSARGADLFPKVLQLADENAIISEMTRIKRDVHRQFEQSGRNDLHYVGFRLLGEVENESDYSKADRFFFERRSVILTPRGKAGLDAFSRLQSALKRMGAAVIAMSPQAHDRILAQVSQVPHLAVMAILRRIYETGTDVEITPQMLGGWLVEELNELARLKESGWTRDVSDNVELVQQGLDDLIAQLERVKGEIAAGSIGRVLDDLLTRTGDIVQKQVAAPHSELILTANGDLKAAEQAAKILAKARITICSLDRIEDAEPGTFRLALQSVEERDRAAGLLRSAGLETVVLT
jgi:prephenate dehydrogenase